MIEILIVGLSVVIASGICSMSEAAILSLPMVRARIINEEKHRHAKDLLFLKENISLTIASIVVVNNAINIVGSIFFGQLVAAQFANKWWIFWLSAVFLFLIIVGSEIIPKTIGERFKVPLSLFFAKPLRVVVWFFRPFLNVLILLTQPFLKGSKKLPKVTEAEIKMMLKLGRAEGTVELDEEVLCNRVFKLNDLRAFQIMKPIAQIYALPANKTLAEVKDSIIKSLYSRVAVYDKDPLDIVGVVQHRVLLREIAKDNYGAHVRDFMTDPIFVNWFTKADALLEKFQAYNQHLFIVQDTSGKDVGLVTMEDVLEELFGEIYDEKDIKPKMIAPEESEPDKSPKDQPSKLSKKTT